MKKLIRNRAQCLECMGILESKHRHDFVMCGCFSEKKMTGIFIDGGLDYVRSGAFKMENFKDLSEWEGEDDPDETIHPAIDKEMMNEWFLIENIMPEVLPLNGKPVLTYDPTDLETPYVVAKYDEITKEWTCAHCHKAKLTPKMWKYLDKEFSKDIRG
jgi:hypothetical protein